MRVFRDPEVAMVFEGYPAECREPLLRIREWIFEEADALETIGVLTESLKWDEPSCAPSLVRVGSPIRLGIADGRHVALYVNCGTTLIERSRETHGDALRYAGNRAVLLETGAPVPEAPIRACVAAALTYHRDRRAAVRAVRSA